MALNRRLVRVALVGLVVAGAFGCELMTAVDRDKIPEETAGTGGGSAGTGGKDGGAGTGGTAKGGAGGEDGGTGGLAGSGGVAGTGGVAGSSGAGGVTPECTTPADCDPVANECLEATCNGGKCGTSNKAAGTAVATQTAGDCKKDQCNGNGAIETVNDDADLPVDNNPCTQDKCDNGTPSNPAGPADVDCGTGLKCNATGQCAGCEGDATKCPGSDTDCEKRTCSDQSVCGFEYTKAGTVTTDQVAGDCKQKQCDGAGKVVEVDFDSDATPDDNECTQDICVNGVATHPDKSAGAECTTGGVVCDGAGKCVECTLPIHCTGTTVTACEDKTCEANTCGKKAKAVGTALPAAQQVKGDCKVKQCDGTGASQDVTDDTDLPVDNKECTVDTCTNGQPSNPPKTTGTECGAQGSNLQCNSTGDCVGCITADDCPGTNDECKTKTCTSGVCGFDFAADGKILTAQTTGDCRQAQCDGAGEIKQVALTTDLPNDNNECTTDTCNGDTAAYAPVGKGETCNQDGGHYCDGASKCVACTQNSHCGASDECKTLTCTEQGTCSQSNAASGTNLAEQVTGDCHIKECDGNGGIADNVDNTDKPNDNNLCTTDDCVAGAPTYTPVSQGTTCGAPKVCDNAGHCVGCNSATDCPQPTTICQEAVCDAQNKQCGFNSINENAVVNNSTPGNCHVNVCQSGAVVNVVDNTDIPVDGFDCTQDVCTAGVASNPAQAVGFACNQNGGKYCNANKECVACVAADQCTGTSDECKTVACLGTYTCGYTYAIAGTATTNQTANDCKRNECDGSGNIIAAAFDTDLPVDTKQCTQDVCTNGTPSNPNQPSGTPCTENGGIKCDGAGVCVACLAASDCGGGTFCKPASCSGSHTCGTTNTAANTPLTTGQTPNDCKVVVCDGNGGETTINDNTDVPLADTNDCTVAACNNGSPVQNPAPENTTCNQNGGKVCDNAGNCVACNINTDCTGGATCQNHVCVAAGCTDNVQNGTETDVDCGGSCGPCAIGLHCGVVGDCVASTNECVTHSCTGTVCTATNVTDGTPVAQQTAGDCQQVQCNGAGATKSVALDTDVPADDGNQCTGDTCTAGAPVHPLQPVNTACTQNGGSYCNATGACVQCTQNSQCTSLNCTNEICQSASCTDNIQNQGESDVDCGGTCADCKPGKKCLADTDCETGICTPGTLTCAAPDVTTTTPANAATNVAVNSTITVNFNTAMNAATLMAQAAGGACTGSVQVSRDDFATCLGGTLLTAGNNLSTTFTPAPGLSFGTTYKVRVTTAAQDTLGNALGLQYTMAAGFTTGLDTSFPGAQVVISQVYGGGGSTDPVAFNRDYVELHNRGTSPVNVGGWSIQYGSATGNTWQVATIAAGTQIPAGGYLLAGMGNAAGNGAALTVTPDVSFTSPSLGATDGKVALVSNNTALSGACPTGGAIVDFLGYGAPNCSESSALTGLTKATAALRNGEGCNDTNSNAADFTVGTAAPRNSATTPATCSYVPTVVNETNNALEADFCNLQSPTTLTLAAGATSENVYGRIYEAGVTDAGGAATGVVGQLGFGPANVNPETQSGWTWTNATFNTQYGNDDEYQATFTAPATGSYRYTYRFSIDNGVHWTYCDINGAGSNANLFFETAQLGTLTVQ